MVIENKIHQIAQEYKILKSSRKVGEKFGYNKATIIKYLRQYGYIIEEPQRHKKYSVNSDYFKTLTPKSVYILGWMLSDGYNNEKKSLIQININNKDYKILEFIKAELQYNGQIYNSESTNSAMLTISDATISRDLKYLGCYQNKSRNLKYPHIIPDILFPYLLRGIFEGDGCISQSSKTKSMIVVSICGNRNFIEEIQNNLINIYNFTPTKLIQDKRNVNMDFVNMLYSGKNNVQKFFNIIYNDNLDFVLERKYNKFINILNN